MRLPLQGHAQDLHPLEFAHAGRTKNEQNYLSFARSFSCRRNLFITPAIILEPHGSQRSRLAKRVPSTFAIGEIRLISSSRLSLVTTSTTPSGSSITPLTSVVLK